MAKSYLQWLFYSPNQDKTKENDPEITVVTFRIETQLEPAMETVHRDMSC